MPTVGRKARQLFAFALLAAFVAGGVVAPALHEASHAREFRRQAEQDRLAHAGHEHNGFRVLEPSTVDPGTHIPCVLCHVRFDGVESAHFGPAPDLPRVTVAGETPRAPQPAPVQHFSIRGPPAVV